MANSEYGIIDYVTNNTDSFDVVPYNDIDTAVFTQIVFLDDAASLMPGEGETKGLCDLCYEIVNDQDIYDKLSANQQELVAQIANNPRYENVMVSDFVENPAKNNTPGYTQLSQNLVDNEQFAAMTMSMDINGKTQNVIVFQATIPDSMDGWSEDVGFLTGNPVQADQDAVDYVNMHGKDMDGPIIFGGHSKGEGIELFAAYECDDEVFEKIVGICGFDGPGRVNNMSGHPRYMDIMNMYTKYAPQDSVVGQLLYEMQNQQFIHSNAPFFLMEHDLFTWQIYTSTDKRGNAVYSFQSDRQTLISYYTNYLLDQLVDSMNQGQREKFYTAVDCILHLIKRDEDEMLLEDRLNLLGQSISISGIADVLGKLWCRIWADYVQAFKDLTGDFLHAMIDDFNTVYAAVTEELVQLGADIAAKIRQVNRMAIDVITDCIVFCSNVINGTVEMPNIAGTGMPDIAGTGMQMGSYISVDTYKLRDYARRLQNVNARLAKLDVRLRQLYAKEKWADLLPLIQSDLIEGERRNFAKCIDYLNETADDFERTENEIAGFFE